MSSQNINRLQELRRQLRCDLRGALADVRFHEEQRKEAQLLAAEIERQIRALKFFIQATPPATEGES